MLLGAPTAYWAIVAGLIGPRPRLLLDRRGLALAVGRLAREPALALHHAARAPSTPLELVPVLSWVALRGRCRGCGAGVSWRYPAIELASGALAAGRDRRLRPDLGGPRGRPARASPWCPVVVIDLEHRLIPDVIVLPGRVALALAVAIAADPARWWVSVAAAARRVRASSTSSGSSTPAGMGRGDANLALLLGAVLGASVVPALFVAFALGAALGVALLARFGVARPEDGRALRSLPRGRRPGRRCGSALDDRVVRRETRLTTALLPPPALPDTDVTTMSTVVALDIGSSSIAGVELKTARERVTLAKAAVEPLPPGLVHDGEIVRPEELAAEIKRFWRTARFSGKRVRLGVANQRVVVRTIELPALDDDRERRAAVEFEAAEQIPIPPDQTVVDSQPVLRFSQRGRRPRAPRRRRRPPGHGRGPRRDGAPGRPPARSGIDLEAFAILRALLPPPLVIDEGSSDTPAVAVCHVGAEVTNMIVAVDRRCHFTRLVGFGGSHLTKAVSERTGLPAEEAEAVKTACGLLGEPLDGWDADTVAEVRHALALGARPLVREISRSLDYYRSQSFARPIGSLVISGGTSLCTGIDRYLQQGLGIPVELGDPGGQLDDSGDLTPDLGRPRGRGPRPGARRAGAVMKAVNLLPQTQRRTPGFAGMRRPR